MLMGIDYAYLITLGFIFYIVGLIAPSLIKLIIHFFKDIKSKKYKYYRQEKCGLCVVAKHMFLVRGNEKTRLGKACFTLGIASIFVSASMMMFFSFDESGKFVLYDQLLSIFVGIWAPTLILIALYLKKDN
jgi:hypothetical protein